MASFDWVDWIDDMVDTVETRELLAQLGFRPVLESISPEITGLDMPEEIANSSNNGANYAIYEEESAWKFENLSSPIFAVHVGDDGLEETHEENKETRTAVLVEMDHLSDNVGEKYPDSTLGVCEPAFPTMKITFTPIIGDTEKVKRLNWLYERFLNGFVPFRFLFLPEKIAKFEDWDDIPRSPSQHKVPDLSPNMKFNKILIIDGRVMLQAKTVTSREWVKLWDEGVKVEHAVVTPGEQRLLTDRKLGKFRCQPSALRRCWTFLD